MIIAARSLSSRRGFIIMGNNKFADSISLKAEFLFSWYLYQKISEKQYGNALLFKIHTTLWYMLSIEDKTTMLLNSNQALIARANPICCSEGRPAFVCGWVQERGKNVNSSLFYFKERTQIPKFYQVHSGNKEYEKKG